MLSLSSGSNLEPEGSPSAGGGKIIGRFCDCQFDRQLVWDMGKYAITEFPLDPAYPVPLLWTTFDLVSYRVQPSKRHIIYVLFFGSKVMIFINEVLICYTAPHVFLVFNITEGSSEMKRVVIPSSAWVGRNCCWRVILIWEAVGDNRSFPLGEMVVCLIFQHGIALIGFRQVMLPVLGTDFTGKHSDVPFILLNSRNQNTIMVRTEKQLIHF